MAAGTATAIGIGSGLLGGIIQGNAAKDAANTQSAAADRANQLQWEMFQQQRQDQDPWRQAGVNALYGTGGLFRRTDGGSGLATTDQKTPWMDKRFAELRADRDRTLSGISNFGGARDAVAAGMSDEILRRKAEDEWSQSGRSASGINSSVYELDPELTRRFTNDDFVKDPGYDFRMSEGMKALERSAAARGGLMSGGTLKGISRYGQDYASNEYQNAYNRFTADQGNRFNRLSALAGMGQAATNQVGAAGQNYAGLASQNMMGAANARGAAGISAANGWANTLSGIGNNVLQSSWMDRSRAALGGGAGGVGENRGMG